MATILYLLFYTTSAIANSDCGVLFNTVFNYDQKLKKAKIIEFFKKEESFCDSGKKELNANILIKLFDSQNKEFDSKKIYIQPTTQIETVDANDKLKKISLVKSHFEKVYRPVQFEIPSIHTSKFSYKIYSLSTNELIGEGDYHESK